MKVRLINYTPDPDKTVYKAARTCYQAGTIEDIQEPGQEKLEKFIAGLIKSGHTSTLEHVSFTFAVESISRVVSHELVRHRIASYSQQSQRYVKYQGYDLFNTMHIPRSIKNNEECLDIYRDAMYQCSMAYNALINKGIKAEDARYVLPNATPTQLVCTFNARSLLNFFKLRCCKRAQPEMQLLALRMLRTVRKVAPVIFKDAGAQCKTCTEERKCNEAD